MQGLWRPVEVGPSLWPVHGVGLWVRVAQGQSEGFDRWVQPACGVEIWGSVCGCGWLADTCEAMTFELESALNTGSCTLRF